jgi:IS4 transposase
MTAVLPQVRIETNNREFKTFIARTTSADMKIRRIYYSLAALLYNLWIVMRVVLGELRSHWLKRILDVMLNVVAQPPPFGGPGAPV